MNSYFGEKINRKNKPYENARPTQHTFREPLQEKQKRKQREKSGGLLKRESRDLRRPQISEIKASNFGHNLKKKGIYLKTFLNKRTELGVWQSRERRRRRRIIWVCF